MEKREIKFCLVFRDMWQSAGKYVPRADQLRKIAPEIIRMGCFSRVETNGGGFEQICLLFGENPNDSVREWTKPFRMAGIQTQMLDRGLNGLRLSPVPADVRKLMFKVKKSQGTDIARIFCGLNDIRNIKDSIIYAKEAGMVAQAALSITVSPINTVDYYVTLANECIAYGADEIALKDMSGIGRPTTIGKIVKGIKDLHPNIPIQYHNHAGPGFASASILEAARAGADFIDVGMEPLSWGSGHVDLLTVQAMLKDDGFKVSEINMDAYMAVRTMCMQFMDDFLGYFINQRSRQMSALLIEPGLPGGMMGSLMDDFEQNLNGINKWLEKKGKTKITEDDLMIKLFDEVKYIWPKLGYPPLVTPFSQYVKNLAIMNVILLIKEQPRWTMIFENIWDMIGGKTGKLPGPLAPEIIELARANNREFYTGNPQDLYPDMLEVFKKEMIENDWDLGRDDEELFELAMHPEQFRAYKSGKAKKAFIAELEAKKKESCSAKSAKLESIIEQKTPVNFKPTSMKIDINGELFAVKVMYDENQGEFVGSSRQEAETAAKYLPITSPLEGKFFLKKDSSELGLKVGDYLAVGDFVGYIESMKTFNAIYSNHAGTVAEICYKSGDSVQENAIIVKLLPR
jgi:pyruvate carboxylase subunit B